MKTLVFAALTVGFAGSALAVELPGIAKNVVMSCSNGDNKVVVLSDNYTTTSHGKLAADGAGDFYVIKGQINREGSNFSIQPAGKASLLVQTEEPGWFSKGLGVFENKKYRMDLQSVEKSTLSIEDLSTGEVLQCHAHGDCC